MKTKHIINLTVLSILLVLLCGCAVAAYEAVVLGGMATSGMDKTTVDAAVTPGVTKEQLKNIKKVAILFDKGDAADKILHSGGLINIMSDNITIELMKLGFECVDWEKIKGILPKKDIQKNGDIDLENILKAGKKLKIDAVLTGNIKASNSTKASGLFGAKVSTTTKIQSSTLKIYGAEKGNILMVIAINYKKGKSPDKAAKSIAKILKKKLLTPFDEVKKK